MSIGLLENIDKILAYHCGEFRALSESAQRDIRSIRLLVSEEISEERTRIAIVAERKVARKKKK
ncbi:MAG: hypothetical protein IIB77_04020 [Proteobacteria bacterium]|nr:hypothetical protein [Pseudomonadota bacterium]